jgi:hypothetical protein
MQGLPRVLSVFALTCVAACEGGSSDGPAPIAFNPPAPPTGAGFVAQYAPPVDVGPYPNDIYNLPGQTLSVPEKFTSPLSPALNTLDGFSTTAKISAPFNAPIDMATVIPFNPLAPSADATVFVLNATMGVPLVPGFHYNVRASVAAGTNGAILEFVPLRPLEADSTYAFILTDGIASTAGVSAGADTVFRLVRDAHLAGVLTGNPGLDALLPAIGPLLDAGVGLLGLDGASIVSAWSVSTQSISDVLDVLAASAAPRNSALAPMGIDTSDLGVGLPGIADLFAGFLELPYYGDPTDPLGSVWVNSSFVPPTRDDPVPLLQGGLLRVPVLASLPNAMSGQSKPADGWPIVVVVPGVTANRLLIVTIADAFAQAGFGVLAIDLPLHGVTDINSPFYQGPNSPFGNNERHFNMDNVGPLGDFAPDGLIDDGWQIFNVSNPLNARDHARQLTSDLLNLVQTIPSMDFDGDAVPDADGDRLHLVTASLGSMLAMAFVGLSDDISTVTMSSPGGPFSGFLFDPDATAFGLPIVESIAAAGLPVGTLAFENFARDLQTVLDPIDPANYAAAAAAAHPIHAIEVLSDTAVTPALTDSIAALMGLVDVTATTFDATGLDGIVRFTGGGHSSLFNPALDFDVTVEMQTEAVVFAASGGTTIQITNSAVVEGNP